MPRKTKKGKRPIKKIIEELKNRLDTLERREALSDLKRLVEKKANNVVFYGVPENNRVNDFVACRMYIQKEFGVKANKAGALHMVDCWRSETRPDQATKPLTVKFGMPSNVRTVFGRANSKGKGHLVAKDLPKLLRQGRKLMVEGYKELAKYADVKIKFPATLQVDGEDKMVLFEGFRQEPAENPLTKEVENFDTNAFKAMIEEVTKKAIERGVPPEGYPGRGRGKGTDRGRGKDRGGHRGGYEGRGARWDGSAKPNVGIVSSSSSNDESLEDGSTRGTSGDNTRPPRGSTGRGRPRGTSTRGRGRGYGGNKSSLNDSSIIITRPKKRKVVESSGSGSDRQGNRATRGKVQLNSVNSARESQVLVSKAKRARNDGTRVHTSPPLSEITEEIIKTSVPLCSRVIHSHGRQAIKAKLPIPGLK